MSGIRNTTKTATILDALPGAIEASEARGQTELVNSSLLPVDGLSEVAEKLGIKIGEPVKDDSLFVHVELPAGWSRKATDHSMWSDLVDADGQKRASIFYKAAFYDRRAFIRLEEAVS